MAANEPKMKINVGADTTEFNKGIRSAKADLKAFGGVSDDVFSKMGAAIGLDTKQLDTMTSAIRGMGLKIGAMGGEGETAFKKIATAASTAGAAIAGIGLAGALVAFKALTAEAENFKSTVAGANIEMQTAAYVQTYTQVMHDFVSDTGKSVAEVESRWKKFWGTLGSNIKSYFATGAFKEAMTPWSDSTEGYEAYFALREKANQAGRDAERISADLFDIDRQRSANLVKIAELEKTISENQRIMKSDASTLAEKQAAYEAAMQAISDKYAMQLPLMQKRASLLKEMADLAGSTVEEEDAANQAAAEAVKLKGQEEDEMRSLERLGKSINADTRAQNAALREQLEIQKQIAQSREDLKALNLGVSGAPTAGATTAQGGGIIPQNINTTALQEQINAALGGNLFVEVGIQIEKGSLYDISQQVTSLVSGMAESMSAAVGGLIGDLLTGGDAWGNFANAALSAFGDMATSVGKIAIECGIASLGIKDALETLGPAGAVAAIGAGMALVALGAAVKAGLSNVANGNYSASSNVASGSYGMGGGDYETRDVNIHVTGQLRADGDQLVAVIENTTDRNNYTT